MEASLYRLQPAKIALGQHDPCSFIKSVNLDRYRPGNVRLSEMVDKSSNALLCQSLGWQQFQRWGLCEDYKSEEAAPGEQVLLLRCCCQPRACRLAEGVIVTTD